MVLAALTGNYGMGKSTVAALFRECGADTLDSDLIVAGLLAKKSVLRRIAEMLGPDMLNDDRSLNKQAVARIVFGDAEARKKLEALLHPLVLKEIDREARKLRATATVLLVEVPLLFESGFERRFDRTITVFTNQKTALGRLKGKGVSRSAALARLHAQMDIRKKKRLADFVIDNSGTKQQVKEQVKKIYKILLEG